MKRAGEEQETQHALHQHFVEIDAEDRGADCPADAERGHDGIDPDSAERRHERDNDDPNRRRQAEEAMVEIAEHRGQGDHRTDGREEANVGHCACPASRRMTTFYDIGFSN